MAKRLKEESRASAAERPPRSEGWRWEMRVPWRLPSPEEVEQRFEEMIRRRWRAPEAEPAVDVFVLDREIWVEIDLPGVREGEVWAQLEHGTLVVEATREIAPPGDRARAARLERPRGVLRRRVPLPTAPRTAQLEMRLESGVLRIRIVPEAGS